jgi:hypothetical protein
MGSGNWGHGSGFPWLISNELHLKLACRDAAITHQQQLGETASIAFDVSISNEKDTPRLH